MTDLSRAARGIVRVMRGDPDARFQLLTRIGRWLAPNYRFKWPQMSWWDDARFTAYLERYGELGGFNTDRRWMVYQLMRLTDAVDGDTAECGVFEGSTSHVICDVARSQSHLTRHHFVFDSFEGLSAPEAIDGDYWHAGALARGEDLVRENLGEFPRVTLLKGWIPERFQEVADRRFAFVHIDVDLAQPTLDSLTFFYPRMNPGGVIVCDDYGYTTCPGATAVVDQFLSDRPEKMLSLSCGGGFLIKGVETSRTIDHGVPVARPTLNAAA
jgi:hypothetical protein